MKTVFSIILCVFFTVYMFASQKTTLKSVKPFTQIIKLKTTPVKNQFRSNTCWAFATISFLESELIREKNIEVDLSEMYIVRMAYVEKARRYIRMHGKASFSNGGSLPDALYIVQKYGILPVSAYRGIPAELKLPDHIKLDSLLRAYTDSVVGTEDHFVNNWEKGFNTILDRYMGVVPVSFTWNGKSYSPQQFGESLGINMSDYMFISSIQAYPYYIESVPEFPDNWLWAKAFNVPWFELEKTILFGLKSGFTCGVCCDISEEGYSYRGGIAEFSTPINMDNLDSIRQSEIDNFKTSDEHAMQAVGIALDSLNQEYIEFKNSWGETYTPYNGRVYMSIPYLRMKVISIIINKKAVPPGIMAKFKICD